MKLSELQKHIDAAMLNRIGGEHEVRIVINEPSIGGTASVGVKSASIGIDWDGGRFLIHAEEPIIIKKQKKR